MRAGDLLKDAIARLRGRKRPVRVTFSAHAHSQMRLEARGGGPRDGAIPRPLTVRERDVLAALLRRPFTGRDELLQQVATARALRGCDCGCPTIALVVDETLPTAAVKQEPEPVLGYVDEASGRHHEISLIVRGGYLRQLELVSYGNSPAREWPDLARMRLMVLEEPTWSDGT